MIGFTKYKLFKWLWNDICEKLRCEYCPVKRDGLGVCDGCGNKSAECYDIKEVMFKAGRKAWEVE